jgi:hypothetical protein
MYEVTHAIEGIHNGNRRPRNGSFNPLRLPASVLRGYPCEQYDGS